MASSSIRIDILPEHGTHQEENKRLDSQRFGFPKHYRSRIAGSLWLVEREAGLFRRLNVVENHGVKWLG